MPLAIILGILALIAFLMGYGLIAFILLIIAIVVAVV